VKEETRKLRLVARIYSREEECSKIVSFPCDSDDLERYGNWQIVARKPESFWAIPLTEAEVWYAEDSVEDEELGKLRDLPSYRVDDFDAFVRRWIEATAFQRETIVAASENMLYDAELAEVFNGDIVLTDIERGENDSVGYRNVGEYYFELMGLQANKDVPEPFYSHFDYESYGRSCEEMSYGYWSETYGLWVHWPGCGRR
jgi:hypothetical protein